MKQVSDEMYQMMQEMLDAKRRKETPRSDLPDPSHRGVIDSSYVRGSDVREFPKMAYRADKKHAKGYQSRVVESNVDQEEALKNGWIVEPKAIQSLLEKFMPKTSDTEEMAATAR